MSYQDLAAQWPVPHVAVAVISPAGVLGSLGDQSMVFPLASVTKTLAAYAVLIAVEEGGVSLDDQAGPQGSTVRHLLAHAAGYEFDRRETRGEPGVRRMYSNAGFEVLAEFVAQQTGIDFNDYAHEAVFEPLGMASTTLGTSPAAGGLSSVSDLSRFAQELLAPTLIDSSTWADATSVQFPGIDGLLPGYGRQKPNDWGLGFEIRDSKSPHWTAPSASPRTFGHFGQSGTFLWVDPDARLACVALTDRAFGDWAIEVWPPFSQAVLDEFRQG
ncbi:serine hydrolase domain-containing protein [Timonella senegalensis]|uniref:serine hydrolase domain-containing protein n=1 Tax=Timonella senegalensis TaxID=1465825 RepID=UPI000310C1AC|nr:serine hydrolase domain-containing protein [Timonella senegalensis]